MSELGVVPEQLTQDAPAAVDDLSRITELMTGDSPKPAESDAGLSDEAQAADPPPPAEIAEGEPEIAAAEPDDDEPPAEIDYDALVPMPDGAESVTIGQLKDHYRKIGEFSAERETWDANRMMQDNRLLAAKSQLYELAGLMGDVNPAVADYLQKQAVANRESEATKLLEVFPEWVDPAIKKAASPALVDTIKQYGYTEADFAHITDHRHIKILSDLSKLQARDKAGREKAEQLKADLPKGQKSVQRKQTAAQAKRDKVKRAQSGTENEKLSAIGSLIDGA